MSLTYKLLSNFYDLIDVIYFRKNGNNPRKAILNCINDNKVKILDMCTGTASNSMLVAKNKPCSTVIGIDISKEMLDIGKEKIRNMKLDNIELLERDACSTEFENNTFDVVIISLVLHEIDTKLADKILKEVHRILKQDGNLIVLEWEQPQEVIKRFLFTFIKLLEPSPFKTFFKADKHEYFFKHNFTINKKFHCDYSCVYKLSPR